MNAHADRVADDREILLARVDELTVVVAALQRAMQETRHGLMGQPTPDLSHESIVEFLNTVETDLAYLRGMAGSHLQQAIVAEASLRKAHDELASALSHLATTEAAVDQWEAECGRLRGSRDEIASELLALQRGRWMRLGRFLGVGRWSPGT